MLALFVDLAARKGSGEAVGRKFLKSFFRSKSGGGRRVVGSESPMVGGGSPVVGGGRRGERARE
jgi:hypothetical protein